MKDTIYRADAIEAVRNVMCNKIGSWYDLAVFAIEALSALPSADADRPKVVGIDYSPYRVQTTAPPAEAVQGWIPCSERLPDVGQDVIFCDDKWTEEGCLRADGDWWQFRWSTVMPKEKVTAWMPLPKPYKGGDVE